MQVLSAIQHAQLRLKYEFTEADFLDGKVGEKMVPEDFDFEENVSNSLFMLSQLFPNSVPNTNIHVTSRILEKTRQITKMRPALHKHVLPPTYLSQTDFPTSRRFHTL